VLPARPTSSCARRAGTVTTISRSISRGAASCARFRRLRLARRSRKQINASGENAVTAASILGKPTSRIDGRAKVTGAAKYAAEYNVPGLAHGFVVTSAIAKGRVGQIDMADALAVDGVIAVFTHANRPKMAKSHAEYSDDIAPAGKPFRPLYDDRICFS